MIIFRYLFFEYIKLFFFCLLSFIAILMTTRLEDIARFAAFGANYALISHFIALQIPYILPMVTPVASLIAAIVIAQKLSNSQELTALRASGFSISFVFLPVFIASLFFTLGSFYLVSEVATESLLNTRKLQRHISVINPLSIMHQKRAIKHRDIYVFTDGQTSANQTLNELIIAIWNGEAKRINLFSAKELQFVNNSIEAKNLSMLSTFKANQVDSFDNLYLENIQQSSMGVAGLSLYLKQQAAKVNSDYLKMSMLVEEIETLKSSLRDPSLQSAEKTKIEKKLTSSYSDIIRRISISLAVFTMTLLGISFGITTSRTSSYKNALTIILLASLLLVSIFLAKAFHTSFLMSSIVYLVPQALIITLSYCNLYRINRGAV